MGEIIPEIITIIAMAFELWYVYLIYKIKIKLPHIYNEMDYKLELQATYIGGDDTAMARIKHFLEAYNNHNKEMNRKISSDDALITKYAKKVVVAFLFQIVAVIISFSVDFSKMIKEKTEQGTAKYSCCNHTNK